MSACTGKALLVHDLTCTVGSVPTTAKAFENVWDLEVLKAIDLKVPLTPEPDEYRTYAR
ncbi:hypothetical protein MF271_23635 (plasmid) [Deinococcus sp. KNUC1210]|uniref:hypothetical protein n=1 Tax=Deinococcus sp. KNUC1210 TaxID=2917691 RepID=UPI001EEFEEBC|nr:hypothetical protein [Deinococcus sp. KNUC1210]ULH17957.1 hypothetical protein MF271_23635 [Deinococcus sp. KNUC1210]